MKCVSNKHLTSILSTSEAAPFLFCTNQPWHVLLHKDKLINGMRLLPVTGTRTPCTSDNILCMHYISPQVTLFLRQRHAWELWVAGDKDKDPDEEKLVSGIHAYFQRALILISVRASAFLYQKQKAKYQEPLNTTIWYIVFDTHS